MSEKLNNFTGPAAIDAWDAGVEALVARGLSKPKAIRKMVVDEPTLHTEYLRATTVQAQRQPRL